MRYNNHRHLHMYTVPHEDRPHNGCRTARDCCFHHTKPSAHLKISFPVQLLPRRMRWHGHTASLGWLDIPPVLVPAGFGRPLAPLLLWWQWYWR